jgi:hypothetical protein
MAERPIRVSRAPVLTLWAAVVAEALGHSPETAISLGSAVAGTAARARSRRPGSRAEPGAERLDTVVLLGAEVPVAHDADGVLCAAEPDGTPAPGRPAENYLRRVFGERLEEVREAMRAVARSYPPEDLNRFGMRIYESFRPQPADGSGGHGSKSVLDVGLILERQRAPD